MSRNELFVGRFAILCSILFSVTGCGEKEAKPTDPQASVSGSVTFNGTPVTVDSSVVFICKDKGATAAGLVDSLGNYSLRGGIGSIGIPAGRYQVAIRAPNVPAPAVGTKEYEEFMSGKNKQSERPKDIPSQFEMFETSGIVLEVKPGENKFDFDLAKLKKGEDKPIERAP